MTTIECPACGVEVTVRSSHPITIKWGMDSLGRYVGEAFGATDERTRRFTMATEHGWSTAKWPGGNSIRGDWMGLVHECTGNPPHESLVLRS